MSEQLKKEASLSHGANGEGLKKRAPKKSFFRSKKKSEPAKQPAPPAKEPAKKAAQNGKKQPAPAKKKPVSQPAPQKPPEKPEKNRRILDTGRSKVDKSSKNKLRVDRKSVV